MAGAGIRRLFRQALELDDPAGILACDPAFPFASPACSDETIFRLIEKEAD